MGVFEFIDFASVAAHRIAFEYSITLQTDEKVSQMDCSPQLLFEMRQCLELYQTFQLDYDMFDQSYTSQLSLFIVS